MQFFSYAFSPSLSLLETIDSTEDKTVSSVEYQQKEGENLLKVIKEAILSLNLGRNKPLGSFSRR